MALKRFLFIIVVAIMVFLLAQFNNGVLKRTTLRKPRIYLETPKETLPSQGVGPVGKALAGAALAVGIGTFAIPAALSAFGFGTIGVAAGSWAAYWQSFLGGAVSSGTTFSALQSLSMAGLGGTTYGVLATIGVISGSQLGTIRIGNEELTIDPETVEELFNAFDFDEDDTISNSDLKEVLHKIEPQILKNLDLRYYKVTERTLSHLGNIKYSEYVKFFHLQVLEGEALKKMLEGVFEEKRKEKRNVYCEDVKEMLPHLRVQALEEKVNDACNYVTNGEYDQPISFLQFLRIFGL